MNRKTVIVLVLFVSLLLFGGIGAGFYFMWTQLSSLKADAAPASEPESAETAEAESRIGPVVPLETFIVNLADPGRALFLKITINLELDDAPAQEEIARRLPQIRDMILTHLPTKKSDELLTVEGKQALRDSLAEGINGRLRTGKVRNVYFSDFVIQ